MHINSIHLKEIKTGKGRERQKEQEHIKIIKLYINYYTVNFNFQLLNILKLRRQKSFRRL